MSGQIVSSLVTFLHDLFTVVWIGGIITLGFVVLPAARQTFGTGPETKKLLGAVQKRLRPFVYVSMLGLIVTGALMARQNSDFAGLFSFGNTYSLMLGLKHIFVVAMIAVSLFRSFVLGRRPQPLSKSQEKLSMALLFVNIALGIVVLFFSGATAIL